MRLSILILLTLILFSASKNDDTKSLRFTCWDLISVKIHPDSVARLITKSKPFLIIKDSVFYGNSGCNDFVGGYSVRNDSIVFGWPGATKISCPEIQWIEDALIHKLMNGKVKYTVAADSLTLFTRNSCVFKFYKKLDKSKCFCKFSEE